MLRFVLWAAAAALLPTQQVYGGPSGSSYLWLRLFGVEGCPWNLASLAAFSASLAYLMAAGRWMTGGQHVAAPAATKLGLPACCWNSCAQPVWHHALGRLCNPLPLPF